MDEKPKALEIDRDIRENIGKLMIVMSATTDPGMKIQITAAVIACLKGVLKVLREKRVPEEVPALMQQVLSAIVDAGWRNEADLTKQEELRIRLIPLHEKLLALYRDRTERDLRKDLEILRDVEQLTSCAGNWRQANYIFVNDSTSWAQSSALLADIQPVLWEIAVRHELIVMPKWEPFDLAGGWGGRQQQPMPPQVPQMPPMEEGF
jgi:hypothetical protein